MHRTWDVVAGAQISCFGDDTKEGQLQLATLRKWRTGGPGPDITGSASLAQDGSAIFWAAHDDGSARPAAIYLLPSIQCATKLPLMPNVPARTLSFFGMDTVFYHFKVLAE